MTLLGGNVDLNIKLLTETARIPTYAREGDACFDIYADIQESVRVMPQHPVTINTGLSFEVPEGWVMKIYSRSGHGFNSDVRLANCVGIIDSGYRGELKVKLTMDDSFRHKDPFIVNPGDRIAQGMLDLVYKVNFVPVDDLSKTDRGEGGFGSSGA